MEDSKASEMFEVVYIYYMYLLQDATLAEQQADVDQSSIAVTSTTANQAQTPAAGMGDPNRPQSTGQQLNGSSPSGVNPMSSSGPGKSPLPSVRCRHNIEYLRMLPKSVPIASVHRHLPGQWTTNNP